MAIQIRGAQIQNDSIGPTQIDETATYDFSSGVVSVATPSAAAHAATKGYVDSQVGDGFQGGDGIAIDTSTNPDTIAVDLATNPGLQFTSNKLDLKLESAKGLSKGANGLAVALKSESGGTIAVDASGLHIADSAIGNAKLANSTISGVALGSNLNALTPATNGGVLFSSYNGSAAVGNLQLDISDLAAAAVDVNADFIAIYDADADVTGKEAISDFTAAIAGDALTVSSGVINVNDDNSTLEVASDTLRVKDAGITPAKLSFQSRQDVFTPNGSTLAFNLANDVNSLLHNFVMVFRNGLLQKKVASSPSDDSEYTVGSSGGTTTVTFGANINSSDALEVRYLA